MSWQLLITLQTFLIAFGLLMIRAVARQKIASKSLLSLNAIQSFFYFLGSIILLPLIGHFDYSKAWQYKWWFLLVGALSALSNIFIFKLMKYLDAGFSSLIITSSAIFTIIFADLLLGERLSAGQRLGAVILFAGICYGVLVARDHHKKTKRQSAWYLGLLFGLCAAVIGGLGDVNQKYILDHMNVATYLPVQSAVQTAVSIMIAAVSEPRGFGILKNKAIMRLNVLGGFSRSIAGVLFLLALVKSNNIALISVVTNFRLVIIILLGAIILKERQRLGEKFISAVIAIIGLSIIFSK